VSVHVSATVWRRSQAKGSDLLVLLAIADNADAETAEAFPSIKYLSRKTRLSERGVQYAIAHLIESGELERLRRGARGRASLYRINTQLLRQLPDRLPELTQAASGIDANGNGFDATAFAYQPSEEPSEEIVVRSVVSYADERPEKRKQ
jgi:hypothetical protein